MKGAKLSLALLCGLVFLLACVPTALGCYTDIKPGSYPNTINVNNNGLITIAIQKEVNSEGLTILPETLELYLYKGDEFVSKLYDVPHEYEYVDYLEIDPYLTGNPIYKGPGYTLKIRTQDLSGLFTNDVIGAENLYLKIGFSESHPVIRAGTDSVRLVSNNN